MIQIKNINLSFGNQVVFNNISFILNGAERIGLYGLNGSGKSTLLKVLSGRQKADSGTIHIAKGKTIAYLPQEVVVSSHHSILHEVMSAFGDLQAMQARLLTLEPLVALPNAALHDIEEYAHLCEKIALYNPEQKRARAEQILVGLGFAPAQFEVPVSTLSVGWRMRVILAYLLLQDADFYFFDEPTNHLDIVAKEWFLDFLQHARFGFMLVCHEKRFLNNLCNTILELERGIATFYMGDYDAYVEEKEAALKRLESAYETQQKTLKQMEQTVNRFRASASKGRMAQSMIKKIDKIERIVLPPSPKEMSIQFPPLEQSGRIVLTVRDLAYVFSNKKIFDHINFVVERGNKIAIVAANGVGKTTLLNVIAGKLPLQSGYIERGYKTTVACFDQDQAACLRLSHTVFENACLTAPQHRTEQQIRSLLGAFLFTGDFVAKKAGVLSGGERNRLGMVSVLLQDANFLLLDEPTNHLDIPSKDILLSALQAYKGTILFVSHDYDFINELATHIIELTPHGAILFHGNYHEYLYQKKQMVQPSSQADEKKSTVSTNQQTNDSHNSSAYTDTHETQKKVRAIEKKIERIETEIKTLEKTFATLPYGSDSFTQASHALHALKKEHASLMQQWESLHE